MAAFDVSAPHTTHCLADGDIMISTMGDNSGNGKGDFILIDGKTKKIKGSSEWTNHKFWRFESRFPCKTDDPLLIHESLFVFLYVVKSMIQIFLSPL